MRGVFVDANGSLADIFERQNKPNDPPVRINRNADITSEQMPGLLDGAETVDVRALAFGIEGWWLDGPVRDLVDGCAALSVSGQVLWGNVASAVNGAAVMLIRSQPGLRARTTALAEALLATPNLAGRSGGTPASAEFRRRSCCLIYRTAPGGRGGYCGDCVLAASEPAAAW